MQPVFRGHAGTVQRGRHQTLSRCLFFHTPRTPTKWKQKNSVHHFRWYLCSVGETTNGGEIFGQLLLRRERCRFVRVFIERRILRSLVTTDRVENAFYPKMRKTLRQNEEEKKCSQRTRRFPLDVYLHH